MSSPTPGWHPDPTARHDYRYWDGWEWTDDVADGGVTAYDPLPADDGYADTRYARYADDRYGDQGYTGYGYTGDPYGSHGNGAEPATRREPDLSYQPPYYATGDDIPGAAKKGPSTRLLVGVGLVAVAMVAGLVFVLVSSGQDDGEQAGTEISDRGDRGDRESGGSTNAGDTTSSSDTTASTGTTSTTAAPGTPGTTAPGGPGTPPSSGGPGTTAAPPGGGGGGGGAGGGSGDEAAVVDDLAGLFHNSSGGAMSEDQARCLAQGMVDTVGVEGARALTGAGGGLPPSLTAEQQQHLQQLTMECGVGG
jgi:uncharacterized protein DUF2510